MSHIKLLIGYGSTEKDGSKKERLEQIEGSINKQLSTLGNATAVIPLRYEEDGNNVIPGCSLIVMAVFP